MENENKTISEVELSLITAISGLDNKLEELDHNLSMISDRGSNLKQPSIDLNKINSKIKELEAKIELISQKNDSEKASTDDSYLKTITFQSRSINKRKGYVVADNLRLKRIEIIERTLARLLKKSHNDTNPVSNKTNQQKKDDSTIGDSNENVGGTKSSTAGAKKLVVSGAGLLFGDTTAIRGPRPSNRSRRKSNIHRFNGRKNSRRKNSESVKKETIYREFSSR